MVQSHIEKRLRSHAVSSEQASTVIRHVLEVSLQLLEQLGVCLSLGASVLLNEL
jgi:hypothetical protein